MYWDVLLFIGVFLVVSSTGLWGVMALDRSRRDWRDRMGRAMANTTLAVKTANSPEPPKAKPGQRKQGAPLEATVFGTLQKALSEAGLRLSPTELIVGSTLFGVAVFAGAVLGLGLPVFLGLVLAIGGPILCVRVLLGVAQAKRIARFTQDLPEALDVFGRGLRAGRPVTDSIGLTAANAEPPLKGEFALCRDQLRLGTDMATSFRNLSERMPTAEVQFFAVATALQSETGGNLIETIEGLTEQLRERRKLRKKIKALSAEVRVSATILASLPFAIGAVILFVSPNYLTPLFHDLRGQIMLGLAVMSVVLGIYVMTRMAKIDV